MIYDDDNRLRRKIETAKQCGRQARSSVRGAGMESRGWETRHFLENSILRSFGSLFTHELRAPALVVVSSSVRPSVRKGDGDAGVRVRVPGLKVHVRDRVAVAERKAIQGGHNSHEPNGH